MPISKHYGGHGREVMKSMKKRYGKDQGERVFYATENKMKPKSYMPAGATQSPKGDLGARRAAESAKLNTIKNKGRGNLEAFGDRCPVPGSVGEKD